jgi:hypothetical protein
MIDIKIVFHLGMYGAHTASYFQNNLLVKVRQWSRLLAKCKLLGTRMWRMLEFVPHVSSARSVSFMP